MHVVILVLWVVTLDDWKIKLKKDLFSKTVELIKAICSFEQK